jgi:hypothetical protein
MWRMQTSKVGIGVSRAGDAQKAGEEAALQARHHLGELPPVLALVFGTVAYDQQALLTGIQSNLPGVPVIGCSTQGLSLSGTSDESARIVGVCLVGSTSWKSHVGYVPSISSAPKEAGIALAKQLQGDGAKADEPIFIWYDPLTGTNTDLLLEGLKEQGFSMVFGAGAGQPFGPVHKTYQYFDTTIMSDAVVGVRLQGPTWLFELTHGTETLGIEMQVTKAEQNRIITIDNEPALDIWLQQDDTGGQFDMNNTASWALGVQMPKDVDSSYEGPITRAVFGFDRESKEVVLQAPIAEGTTIQLCHRTPQAVFDRALEMAERLRQRLVNHRPVLLLALECGARPAPFLGIERSTLEVQKMQEILGVTIPWFGAYAWGEIAPIGSQSYFHNYTFPLIAMCE